MTQATVVFGLGANLGDARAALTAAVAALRGAPGVRVVAVSSLYRTAPVGGPEQPDYLNAVVVAATDLAPAQLLGLAQRIEAEHHRTRLVRWGPRTLDVDILAVGDAVSDDPDILLPHPRAHERGFVLIPWAEVDPGFEVPGRGTVAALAAALPAAETAEVELVDRAWAATEVAR